MPVEVTNLGEGLGAIVAGIPRLCCNRTAVAVLNVAGYGHMRPRMKPFSFPACLDQFFNPLPLFLFFIAWHSRKENPMVVIDM